MQFETKKGTILPILVLQGKPYLQVAHRIVWFREEHPFGRFETQCVESNEKFVIYKAEISIPLENRQTGCYVKLADAFKREDFAHFADAHEKASTGAIGRALALIGFGTQFATELDEGERLADSPIQPAVYQKGPSMTVSRPVASNPEKLEPQVSEKAPNCFLCQSVMKRTKKNDAWYCENYKDKVNGAHAYHKDNEEDVPF